MDVPGVTAAPLWARDVTRRVRDMFADQTDGVKAFIDAVEEANPGIEIARDIRSIDEMRPVIRPALTAGTGPHVPCFETGPAFADGRRSAAHGRHPRGRAAGRALSSDAGAREPCCDGKTDGIGNEVEFLGVYWDKDIFAELGIGPPTSHAELIEIAKAPSEAGNIPVAVGNADGPAAFHVFGMYANDIVGKDKPEGMLFGDASRDDPEIAAAIRPVLVDTSNAVDCDDATNSTSDWRP